MCQISKMFTISLQNHSRNQYIFVAQGPAYVYSRCVPLAPLPEATF